jgi:hypothetical protein
LSARIELRSPNVEPGGRLGYEVLNTGSIRILFGEAYELEQLCVCGWWAVRLPYMFRAVGYSLDPGGSRDLTALIPDYAAPGRYRMPKKVRDNMDPSARSKAPSIKITAEFDVARL